MKQLSQAEVLQVAGGGPFIIPPSFPFPFPGPQNPTRPWPTFEELEG